MVKHTQTIRRQQLTNCLSVFDHFMRLALTGLNISSVGIDFLSLLPSVSLIAIKPDLCGILGYKPTTSAVTRNELLGIFFRLSIVDARR